MGIKVSFITTVYNEEKNIKPLIDSLLRQTKMPDEIIIVDAKSTDGTVRELDKFKSKFGNINFQILSKKGNRSVGRNIAIAKAKGNIIVATDAGCIIDKNWLERITSPFQNSKAEVVAGFYKPITKNTFEKCLAAYTCVMEDKVNSDFLPSSRSVAFRKSVWKSVGGYPEELNTCEDLVFARELKRKGFNFKVAKKAFVLWPQRENIFEAAKQFYQYAVGDGQANYIRFNTWFLFARYITGLILFFVSLYLLAACFILYIYWSIYKNYRYVNDLRGLFFLPVLQLVSDMAVITGTFAGSILRFL